MHGKAKATASGTVGIGGPGVMWALDHMGVTIPHEVVVGVALVGGALVLWSAVLWCRIGIAWLRTAGTTLLLGNQMWLIILMVLGVIFFGIGAGGLAISQRDSAAEGFNYPPWPDAIRCSMKEWQSTVASEFIFYYRGIGISRASVGAVIVYYMPGGYNDKAGYFPHEVWFERDSRKLIPKKRIPDYTTDLIEQRYKAAFPYELDCGEGSTDDALDRQLSP